MSFFDIKKLRGLKRSEEFAEAVPTIEAEILSVKDRISQLGASKEKAIFEGADGDLDAIEAEILSLEREIANLEIAKSGASSRLAEAEKRERNASMEAIAAETRATVKQQLKAYRDFGVAAETLVRAVETIRACDQKILASNVIVVDGGRPDLTVHGIFSQVCQVLAAKYPAGRREPGPDGKDIIIANGFSGMPDPAGPMLLIPGFWPPQASEFADVVRRLQV